MTYEIRYVYDGNLVVQERNEFNLPSVSYTLGLDLSGTLQSAGGIGGLLARSDIKSLLSEHAYYHSDGNGNVTCLTATNQSVVARYLYDPFGNTLAANGPLAETNLYRFSSKELHAASGFVYYLYRYYDPILQRWINRDPLGEDAGYNLYVPCSNDSINSIDPTGLEEKRKRNPDDGLPPEKSQDDKKPDKSHKDYDEKEKGQNYEELSDAKKKCPADIERDDKGKQKDNKELEDLGEQELKKRALERLLKKAKDEEAKRNRDRLRLPPLILPWNRVRM